MSWPCVFLKKIPLTRPPWWCLQNISPTMDGTVVALGVSFIICIVWTLFAPEKNANFDAYKTIELEDCEDITDTNADDPMAMNRALKARQTLIGLP